ncbi:MAG: class I SAM-dependent methyltransferase [Candidatus Thorarchaeota archaeon]|jgi:ubiquinone/menaquinone biosynthesis C-methylase UbiE
MKKDPEDIVRDGYDRIAEQYDEYRSHFNNEAELDEFMSLVKAGGHVLDAGCGTGKNVARALVDNGFQVTGIDFSQKMLDLAKHRVPEATFEVGDMTSLKFEDDSFDGIVSAYAVFHVPRTKHFSLFLDFHRLLKKEGALLFGVGSKASGSDGVWEWDEFQSVPMYWSYHDPEKSVELLKSADFEIIFARNVEDGGETHFWILARAK